MGTLVTNSPIATCVENLPDTSLYNFFQAVLAFFGGNNTYEHYMALAAWSACEGPAGSQGAYNPLNTTWPGGQTNGKTVNSKAGPVTLPSGNGAYLGNNPGQNGGNPVKNYAGWASGVSATVATILGTGIAAVLSSKSIDPQTLANAIGSAHWGTNPSCISSRIKDYQANPKDLCATLSQNVNTSTAPASATDKGGAGQTADQGAAVPVGPSLPDWSGSLGSLLKALTSGTFWKRVGLGVIGLLLMISGFVLILGENKTVQGAAKDAGEAALL